VARHTLRTDGSLVFDLVDDRLDGGAEVAAAQEQVAGRVQDLLPTGPDLFGTRRVRRRGGAGIAHRVYSATGSGAASAPVSAVFNAVLLLLSGWLPGTTFQHR
jgi:hypothetical protein